MLNTVFTQVKHLWEVASFPGLPHFCFLVCIQYNTWKWKSSEKQGRELFCFHVLHRMQSKEQKMERPGNEACTADYEQETGGFTVLS